MPGLKISIGNREFEVACDPGEEEFLTAAAALLDEQAQVFAEQLGRMPESRLLLMSGLMLADKINESQEQVRELEAELAEVKSQTSEAAMPKDLMSELEALATRAEALADKTGA